MEKHTIVWRGVTVEITYTPEEFSVADHTVLRTDGAPRDGYGLSLALPACWHSGRVWRSGSLRHRMARLRSQASSLARGAAFLVLENFSAGPSASLFF